VHLDRALGHLERDGVADVDGLAGREEGDLRDALGVVADAHRVAARALEGDEFPRELRAGLHLLRERAPVLRGGRDALAALLDLHVELLGRVEDGAERVAAGLGEPHRPRLLGAVEGEAGLPPSIVVPPCGESAGMFGDRFGWPLNHMSFPAASLAPAMGLSGRGAAIEGIAWPFGTKITSPKPVVHLKRMWSPLAMVILRG
jgi:hypothetical protein